MITHGDINSKTLFRQIRNKEIGLAGNRKLRIYGKLNCKSGKKMKRANRVFFSNEEEAIKNFYRPCGHCMNEKYKVWKRSGLGQTFSNSCCC
jgi:methylphosphotriester-DNA--protein-cysteine methyltransferase